jgi:prepilin-type N-terminal cleavage/methylation domain-containing protein
MKRVRLNSQVGKAFQGCSRGFTLIEVLIAIAILGTIAITLLAALSTSSMAFIVADERATAESLARSQMEYVKNQGYNCNETTHQYTYDTITIPDITDISGGYSIWSYNRTGGLVPTVIGIAWNSTSNQPDTCDTGIQKIALLIKHQDKEIFTFINDNPNWANGAKITLEGYIRQPVT